MVLPSDIVFMIEHAPVPGKYTRDAAVGQRRLMREGDALQTRREPLVLAAGRAARSLLGDSCDWVERRVRQQTIEHRPHVSIAFARGGFQTLAIDDADMPADMRDDAGPRELGHDERHGWPPDAQHDRQKLVRQRQTRPGRCDRASSTATGSSAPRQSAGRCRRPTA